MAHEQLPQLLPLDFLVIELVEGVAVLADCAGYGEGIGGAGELYGYFGLLRLTVGRAVD